MNPLSQSDLHHLSAAQGWDELGNSVESAAELEQIAPEARTHPDVLDVRWGICAKEQKWTACVEIGFSLVNLAPELPNSWIHRSFALHELKRTQEAFDNLLPAAEKFPGGAWQIPYNLSCYCSVLGRFDEAQAWFKKAMLIDDKAVHRAGTDDPDLKPLWDSMRTTL